MFDLYHDDKKKLIIISILPVILLVGGCNSEEESKEHLQRGVEYFNKGEYEKAKLELKTAGQSDKDTAETYYYLALLDEKNRQFKAMRENLIKTIELAPTYAEARLKLGKVQLLFGEIDAALEQAEVVLKDSSQNPEALALKASALIRQKKPDEALAIIDGILKVNPNFTDALSLKALVYTEKGDFTQALALIDTAIKSDPKNISQHLFKVQLDAKTENIDAVISDYQKLVSLSPENQEFKIALAKIYSQSGKTKEAEEVLRGLIDEEPDNVKAELMLLDFLFVTNKEKVEEQFHQLTEKHKNQPRMLLDLSNWMIVSENFNEARKVLNRVIELEENSNVGLTAKTILAKIAFDQKDYLATKRMVDEILEANSNFDDGKILRARLLFVNKQYDQAIDLLNSVMWSKPDSDEALILLAEAFLAKGDQKQADRKFSMALQANPTNFQALAYVYDKALKSKNIKYAKELLEKAIRLRPDNIALLEKLVKINIADNNWDNAKAGVKKIQDSSNPLANDLATYLQAQILQAQGECSRAVGLYKELLVKFPENSDALGYMARCYEHMNKRSEMVAFLNKALLKRPDNFSAGILLGDLYLADKKFDKGSVLLTNLIKVNPKIPQLYISLANIKLAQNDNKSAIELYQDGLKQNPENVKLSLSLASLYELQGDYDSAVSMYESLLAKNPQLDIAINNLASVLSEHFTDEKKLKRAVDLSEKFKNSEQAYFRDTYAWAIIKQGKINEGVKILEHIINTAPDVPVFRYHLGFAHYKNGNNGAAISELKQALELAGRKGSFSDKNAAETLLKETITKTRSS
ncbi:Beta-barrel assembly-enhancing protease [Candidatus Methylobacter favarea]|uniref:Beta-barrel assembly-enhancing protease n=1 Tax=Candidatus Methylobacter favarea TaxID=2707345 RepID=A0A8S0XQJ8_9GAMM|nr:tetratricopeptide repeat protein [Candidatus Methylobacter favarea]CAA9889377.1 Beta-barrel assembly-enhancing protease [Candidatus Methylobacter favarea]